MQHYHDVSATSKNARTARLPCFRSLLTLVLFVCAIGLADASPPKKIGHNSIEPKKTLLLAFSKWINASGEKFEPTLKLDRRFTVERCSAPYKFERIEYSKNLVRVSCESSRWTKVAKMQSIYESISKPKESQKVPIASRSIKRGEHIKSEMFEYQDVNTRMAPKNLLNVPLSKAFVANKNIKKGDILTQGNLYKKQQAYVAVTTIPSGSPLRRDFFKFTSTIKILDQNILIKDLEGIDFLAANRTIHPGTLLTKTLVRKAKLVNRGDQVVVDSSGKGFSVRATRYALEDGYLGDQVRLESNAGDIVTRGTVAGRNFVIAMKKN